jgi:hypothetical protein
MPTRNSSPSALVFRSVVLIAAVAVPLARAGAQQAVHESPRSEQAGTAAANPAVLDLDVALREALENNPDILVAKAKLQEAEAVLNRTRLRVAQDVLSLRAKAENEHKRAAEAREQAAAHAISTAELRNVLEAAATTEAELQYALGKAKRLENAVGKGAASGRGEVSSHAVPRGPLAAEIRKALGKKASVEFKQIPLAEALAKLGEMSGVNFVLDKSTLEESVGADLTADVSIKDAPLAAVLQVIEDLHPPLRFVAREYGILLTVDGSHSAEDACRVSDVWQSDTESKSKP